MFPKRYHKVLAVGRKSLSAASPSGASWGAEAPRDEVLVVSPGTPWMGQEVAGDGQSERAEITIRARVGQVPFPVAVALLLIARFDFKKMLGAG